MHEFNQLYGEYTKMFDIEMRLKNGGICYNEIAEKSDYEETVNLQKCVEITKKWR